MPEELRVSIEKLVYGGDGLAHADGNTVFVPYVLPALSDLRRLPLPAYPGRGAVAAEERDFARDAVAARRNPVDWANSGAFCGALWISQSRAVGGAQRQSAGAWVLSAG